MLTLDTNIAFDLGLTKGSFTHPQLSLLRTVAAVHGIPMALTRTATEEIVGQFTRALSLNLERASQQADSNEQQTKVDAARNALLTMVPRWTKRPEFYRGEPGLLIPPLATAAIADFRKHLVRVFPTTWEKPKGAAEEAEQREIARRLPAVPSGDGAGKGFRDTMIWLTVLAGGAAQPFGNTYFLARDKGFGYPLHPKLQEEAAQSGVRQLVFYDDVARLIDRLSSPANDLPEPVEVLLAQPHVMAAVRRLLDEGNFRVEVADWVPGSSGWIYRPDDDVISVEPAPNNPALAVRIGDVTVVSITRIWRITRMFPAVGDRLQPTEFTFTVKLAIVLFYKDGAVTVAQIVDRDGIWEQSLTTAGAVQQRKADIATESTEA